MASCSLPLLPTVKHRRQCHPAVSSSSSPVIYRRRVLPWSILKIRSWSGRCSATSPGPPSPPPDSGPNSKKTTAPSSVGEVQYFAPNFAYDAKRTCELASWKPRIRVAASFTKFQDTVQIFFAVLFWMSLFFWSSAWDGKNNGRPNKGPRFRK